MRSLPAFRHSAASVLVLLAATTVAAQEVWQVTKLRTQKVALYDCADPSKKTDFPHKDLQGPPWPITSGPTDAGMLVVKVGGADYCVRAYVVETNKAIAAKSDCGALVAMNQPKSGATRGVGEDCKPNKK